MKIKELIEELSKLDPNLEVTFSSDIYNTQTEVTHVIIGYYDKDVDDFTNAEDIDDENMEINCVSLS
jgi:hypothetical protein